MLCHNRELFTARVDALSKVDTGGDTDTHISVEMTMTCFLSSSDVLLSSQKNQWTKVDDDCVCIGRWWLDWWCTENQQNILFDGKTKTVVFYFFISFLQLRFSLRWIFQMFSLPLQSSKLDFWCSSRRRREEAGCNFHLVQFFFQSYFSFAHFRYILDIKCRYTYFILFTLVRCFCCHSRAAN